MSTNTPEAAINDLWAAHNQSQGQLADLANQVQRIRRYAQVDEREIRQEKLSSEQAVIRSVETLTDRVSELLGQGQQSSNDLQATAYYHSVRDARAMEVSRNLERTRHLLNLKRSLTNKCPCGKHKGVQLASSEGNVIVENLCPIHLWAMQGRVAFADHKLAEFNRTVPLNEFLKYFAISQIKS